MGQTNSVFSEQEIDDFEALTFLNRREIQLAFNKFRNLDYENVSKDRKYELPMAVIQSIPELKVNPFRDRICCVFSHSGTGAMTFEDFIDMLSVFSDKSPLQVKLEYAFRIYDFDNDRVIKRDDIKKTVLCLMTANGLHEEDQLTEEQMEFLIDKVLEEADRDLQEGIDFEEFSSLINQKPEFLELGEFKQSKQTKCSTDFAATLCEIQALGDYFKGDSGRVFPVANIKKLKTCYSDFPSDPNGRRRIIKGVPLRRIRKRSKLSGQHQS